MRHEPKLRIEEYYLGIEPSFYITLSQFGVKGIMTEVSEVNSGGKPIWEFRL